MRTDGDIDTRSRAVARDLVTAGLVEAAREDEAAAVARSALGGPSGRGGVAPLRRRMAEVAGYVGGAFVVGAAVLFFANTWSDMSLGGRVAVLLGAGLVLAAAGGGVIVTAGGRRALRLPADAVRRRLASVLLTGAAACAAFGVGVLMFDRVDNESLAVLLAAAAGLAVVLVGYLLAPTVVAQLGAAVAAFVAVTAALGTIASDSTSTIPLGLLVLVLGLVWLTCAELGVWREADSGRVIGCALAVIGAQIPVSDVHAWVGYAVTAAVGAAAFWMYVVRRAWPYLATGVVALTLAVPEAVNDWAGGSVGAAGILLATGVTLLVAALLGLRLRQEVVEEVREEPAPRREEGVTPDGATPPSGVSGSR